MTNFVPIFPLNIVVFPGEHLNLHVVEPGIRQLVSETFEKNKPFGIPAVIKNRMEEMGTLVKIIEISKTYENGDMDIRTEGVSVIKILEVVKVLPDKLYSGAIVNYPENNTTGSPKLMRYVLDGIRAIHRQLNVNKDFLKPDEDLTSYDVAHHLGLSIEDEYQLLQLMHELQRQEFLKRKIKKIMPVLDELQRLKKRISLNGHFKEIEGFNLK